MVGSLDHPHGSLGTHRIRILHSNSKGFKMNKTIAQLIAIAAATMTAGLAIAADSCSKSACSKKDDKKAEPAKCSKTATPASCSKSACSKK
jgi:hypothetical protein